MSIVRLDAVLSHRKVPAATRACILGDISLIFSTLLFGGSPRLRYAVVLSGKHPGEVQLCRLRLAWGIEFSDGRFTVRIE
jgi:hypothetical protein